GHVSISSRADRGRCWGADRNHAVERSGRAAQTVCRGMALGHRFTTRYPSPSPNLLHRPIGRPRRRFGRPPRWRWRRRALDNSV
ncbi:MAG: hypothetical protein AVDCRST_MAG73-4273, partial [uncultured Thermomicrobiales bacterium]